MREEIWKPVTLVDFSHRFEISSLGEVRTVTRRGKPIAPFVLRPFYKNKFGYKMVILSTGSRSNGTRKQKGIYVHRLVALAFCPCPDGCNVVNHIDSDRLNNRAENLEWTTPAGNYERQYEQGRRRRGPLHSKYKIDIKMALEMRRAGDTFAAIGDAFGASYVGAREAIKRARREEYVSLLQSLLAQNGIAFPKEFECDVPMPIKQRPARARSWGHGSH